MEETWEVTEGEEREEEKDRWLFSKDGSEGEHKCLFSVFRCCVCCTHFLCLRVSSESQWCLVTLVGQICSSVTGARAVLCLRVGGGHSKRPCAGRQSYINHVPLQINMTLRKCVRQPHPCQVPVSFHKKNPSAGCMALRRTHCSVGLDFRNSVP